MGFPMSLVAPKARKHLSADALLHLVRSGFATIPDPRGEDVDIACTDALMAACARFARTSPALLALDTPRAEGHWGTLYGRAHVPCAPQGGIRMKLRQEALPWASKIAVSWQC